MPFVKLDTGILDSTLWIERECRELFITALLMAEPREFLEPQKQIEIASLDHTGFEAPPGWYGFVPAASYGIINRAMVDKSAGLAALEKLGNPEIESRSREFDGRRMIRINGGFLILNFMKYRDRDYTGAERARRYRERQKLKTVTRDDVDITRDDHVTEALPTRDITQAECRVQSAEAKKIKRQDPASSATALPALGTLPCLKGSWPFTQKDVDEWQEAYPAVDVIVELRKDREWLKANPKNQKTQNGMRRHVNSWLARAQDRAKPNGHGGKSNGYGESLYERLERQIEEDQDDSCPAR